MILQQRMLQTWLFWLFSYFIVPLISAHFYVTESENGKYGVFYYRKDVWDKVSKEAVHYLKENNYRQINISSLDEMFRNRKLGFSKVRFLPKATGVRPIANLGATSKICFNFQRNLNESSTRRERRREEYNSLIFSTQKWKGSAVDHCRKKIKYSFSNKVEDGNALGRGNSHMPHMIPELKKTKAKLFGSYAQDVMSFKSINSLLYDAHQCLKLEKEECSEALGFSVFDYNDVFKKLVPFLMNLKVSLMGPPKFYVVACDIEKAFDSVSHDKLLSIMEQCLQRDKYWVQRYKRISYFGTKVRVAYERCFVQDMNQNASGNIPFRTRKHCHCIFINQATLTMVKREELFSLIMEHVKRNVTRIGGIFYIQKVGIPQGSVLSSLLFSFYYGHLERNKILPLLSDIQQHTGPVEYTVHHPVAKASDDLSGTNVKKQTSDHEFRRRDSEESGSIKMLNMPLKGTHNEAFCKNEASAIDLQSSQDALSYNPSCFKNNKMNYGTTGPVALDQKSLVLRLIDDFLLISTSREASVSFVIAMHEGFREYNCRSNHKKTSLNFDMEISGKHLLQNMQVSEDGSCFIPWAGLLINASSLEIQADYKRYCDVHIRSTITVWRQRKPGCHLLMKLGQFVRPKCHPILYDVNINSRVTVRLNAYQAFLLCAMKFHAYVSSMPPDGCFNARNQFKAIFKTSRYFYTLLIQRIRNICLEMGMSPQRPFMLKEIEWLALLAFYKVLLRKQCRYRQLIKLLKIKASNSRYKNLPWADLEQAVDDSRSSVLWKLRY